MTRSDVLGARPELADGWRRMSHAISAAGLDPELRRWAVDRVRFLVGAGPRSGGGTDGVGDDGPAAILPEPALADYVEQYVIDVHGLTDEQSAAARAVLGDAGLVALAVTLGVTEAEARMELMLA